MEGNINQDDNPLTSEQVRSTTSLRFERINVYNEGNTDDKEIEKALVKSQFKGCWNNCGTYGHKKIDFIINGNNDKSNGNTGNKGSFNGTCNYWNKFGNTQLDCHNK